MQQLKLFLLVILVISTSPSLASEHLDGSLCIVTTIGCVTVMEHNAKLPATYSYTFRNSFDNQEEVRIELKKRSSATQEYVPAGNYDLPITPMPAFKARLQVLIVVDKKNKVTINTKDMDSGKTNSYDGGYLY